MVVSCDNTPSAGLTADVAEELADAVLSHPSLFARLLAIASRWNPKDGSYESPDSSLSETQEISDTLKHWHLSVFVHWLSLPLRQQEADISIFLAGNTERVYRLVELGENAVPMTADQCERELFLQDLGIVKALLLYE